EGGSALVAAKHGEQGPLDVRREGAIAVLELGAEHGGVAQELARHGVPLRALAREDEHDLAIAGAASEHGVRARTALGERVEGGSELVAVVRDDRGAMHEM